MTPTIPSLIAQLSDETVVEDVIASHALDGSFLWQQRDRASHAPHYRLLELAELDDRLSAHLHGLRLAGQRGVAISQELLGDEPGDAFVLASIAATLGDEALETTLDSMLEDSALLPGLSAAMGWLPFSTAEPLLSRWNLSERIGLRRIALGGALAHCYDCGPALPQAVHSDDVSLRALALRSAGELGREDLQLYVQKQANDQDLSCRLQARRAALLLGVPGAADKLAELALSGGANAEEACRLAMGSMPRDAARAAHTQLASRKETVRLAAILGAGASGDPSYVPWLLDVMDEPDHARIAMDALIRITGVHIEDDNLEGEQPEGFEEGPTDDPDDSDVAIPDDADLEWPAVDAVRAWWHRHGHAYTAGTPYLMGKLRDRAGLRHVLVHGSQSLRAVAAFELAQTARERAAVFPTQAPALRQQALLTQHGLTST